MTFYHMAFWLPYTIAGMTLATTVMIGAYDDVIEEATPRHMGAGRIILACVFFFAWWVLAIGFIVEAAREGRIDD